MNYKSLGLSIILSLCSTVTFAIPVLDQNQALGDGIGGRAFWSDNTIVQTFTPGMTGYLDSIEQQINTNSSSGDQYYISVVEWTGSDIGAILGTASDVTEGVSTYKSYDFAGQGVYLTAGVMYGIHYSNDLSLTDLDPYRNMGVEYVTDAYAEGSIWIENRSSGGYYVHTDVTSGVSYDTKFATYMTSSVPEPGVPFLLLAGMGALFATRVQKRNTK